MGNQTFDSGTLQKMVGIFHMKLFVSLLYSSEIQANALLVLLLFIVHDQSKLIKNKKQKKHTGQTFPARNQMFFVY